jgi:hypothetical protein
MKHGRKNTIGKLILTAMLVLLSLQFAAARDFDETEINPADFAENSFDRGNETSDKKENLVGFYNVLNQILVKRGWKKEELCDQRDAVISRILREYGSIFVVNERALPPTVCMFTSAEEVDKFQKKASFVSADIAGTRIELQPAAMEALLSARAEALEKGLDITPRDGSEAGRRRFDDTVRLWKSRFEPACDYWTKQGRLTTEQVEKLKALPIKQQVGEVLELEKQGIFFNKFFNNSILYSVAAPGTSQHLSMLALDVNEYENEQVREILAKYGWFQTVRNDQPHFTFLGQKQEDLNKLGLRESTNRNGRFWIPNV